MKMIKLTSAATSNPIYINIEAIGHFYSYRDKNTDELTTTVGVTTHNNGGFKVIEDAEQINKMIKAKETK